MIEVSFPDLHDILRRNNVLSTSGDDGYRVHLATTRLCDGGRAVGHVCPHVWSPIGHFAEDAVGNLEPGHAVAFAHGRDDIRRDHVRSGLHVHRQVVGAPRHVAVDRPNMNLPHGAALGPCDLRSSSMGLARRAQRSRDSLPLRAPSVHHLADVAAYRFLRISALKGHVTPLGCRRRYCRRLRPCCRGRLFLEPYGLQACKCRSR